MALWSSGFCVCTVSSECLRRLCGGIFDKRFMDHLSDIHHRCRWWEFVPCVQCTVRQWLSCARCTVRRWLSFARCVVRLWLFLHDVQYAVTVICTMYSMAVSFIFLSVVHDGTCLSFSLKMEIRAFAMGRLCCDKHKYWRTAVMKPNLVFSPASYAFVECVSQFRKCIIWVCLA